MSNEREWTQDWATGFYVSSDGYQLGPVLEELPAGDSARRWVLWHHDHGEVMRWNTDGGLHQALDMTNAYLAGQAEGNSRLSWHYGTEGNLAERMWCNDCGAEVYSIDGGLICTGCDRTADS